MRKNAEMWRPNFHGWTGRIFIHDRPQEQKIPSKLAIFSSWLDRQDSNLRMLGPKPSALPLGDGPISINITIKLLLRKPRGGKVVGFLKFYKSKEDIIDDR